MGKFDTSYKQFFSHSQMVRELLQSFIKESWVEQIDFSTLEKCNNSYITDDLRERIDDVIWKVRWQGKDLYVYILLELQSTIDKFMSIRIMTYIGLLYQDLIKAEAVKKNQLLPPILPIVLYNGVKKWDASVSVQDIIYPAPRGLNKYTPRLEYLLIDEIRTNQTELKNLNNCVSALFQLEQCRDGQSMLNVVSNLLEWLKSPETDSLRRSFIVWVNRVYMPARFDDDDMPEVETLEELKTMLEETIKRWPKQWMAEGMKKGIEKGRLEGKMEGKLEGKMEAARSLLDILDVEVIAQRLGLSVEQVEALKNDKIQEEPAQYAPTNKKRKKK